MRVTGDHIYIPDQHLGSTLKADAQCYVERAVTREHVYTNNRGWRAPTAGQTASPRDIALIGCSWAMGEAVEYEDTFAARIERESGMSLANIGVGSYSLLQAYRKLEQEIAFINPKLVVVSFGHWLIDRCFKSNAMGNVMLRPIFRRQRSNDELFIEEAGYAPRWLVEAFTEEVRLNGAKSPKAKALYSIIQLKIKKLHRVFYKDSYYVDFDTNNFLAAREHVLDYLLKKFKALAVKHDCKVLFFHMHQYTNLFERDASNIKHDRDFLRANIDNEHLFYEGPEMMEEALKAHESSLSAKTLVESIHCPDNNHPNELGHEIIANCILQAMKKLA